MIRAMFFRNKCAKMAKFSPNGEISPDLGSMLWSQFSAIFTHFWRKNWRFSQKAMLWSQFLQNPALFCVKNANIFAKFFGENIFKIITSVPGHTETDLGNATNFSVSLGGDGLINESNRATLFFVSNWGLIKTFCTIALWSAWINNARCRVHRGITLNVEASKIFFTRIILLGHL
jgi:hypothetical protein